MKKLIILLTLALSFSFVNAEKYPALKVKDYKNVKVVVERMDTDSNTGITAKDIENKIKLMCEETNATDVSIRKRIS